MTGGFWWGRVLLEGKLRVGGGSEVASGGMVSCGGVNKYFFKLLLYFFISYIITILFIKYIICNVIILMYV